MLDWYNTLLFHHAHHIHHLHRLSPQPFMVRLLQFPRSTLPNYLLVLVHTQCVLGLVQDGLVGSAMDVLVLAATDFIA